MRSLHQELGTLLNLAPDLEMAGPYATADVLRWLDGDQGERAASRKRGVYNSATIFYFREQRVAR